MCKILIFNWFCETSKQTVLKNNYLTKSSKVPLIEVEIFPLLLEAPSFYFSCEESVSNTEVTTFLVSMATYCCHLSWTQLKIHVLVCTWTQKMKLLSKENWIVRRIFYRLMELITYQIYCCMDQIVKEIFDIIFKTYRNFKNTYGIEPGRIFGEEYWTQENTHLTIETAIHISVDFLLINTETKINLGKVN